MGPLTLVRFDDVRQQADETKQRRILEPDPVVVQLRHRLTSPDFCDCDATRLSMLAEMVYRIYHHTLSNQKETL